MPDTLAVLDSLDKTDPRPLKGYRIQIYFGDLQGARSVRASFRRDHPDVPCQLMPISPNYAVTVGDYRDLWSAKRALRDNEVGRWGNALVVPPGGREILAPCRAPVGDGAGEALRRRQPVTGPPRFAQSDSKEATTTLPALICTTSFRGTCPSSSMRRS